MNKLTLLLLFLSVLLSSVAKAQWTESVEIGASIQLFDNDKNDATKDQNHSFNSRLGMSYEGSFDSKISLFARQDWTENDRNFLNLEEAWISYRKSFYQLKAGVDLFNWSVMEAFHPADVINSRDFNGEIESFQKIGEPVLAVRMNSNKNYFHFNYFPFLISPEFPYKNSRFNMLPTTLDLGSSRIVNSKGELESQDQVNQYAFRYDRKFQNFDMSLYYIDHLERQQPGFIVDLVSSQVHPVFFRVKQWGGTFVYVAESFLVKAEAGIRNYENANALVPFARPKKENESQYALGFEYPYDLSNGMELTTYVEYQNIPELAQDKASSFLPFQNDLSLSLRLALNDLPGQEYRLTTIWDLAGSLESILSITYERRIKDNWKLKTGWRLISAPVDDNNNTTGLEALDGTNYLTFALTRFF